MSIDRHSLATFRAFEHSGWKSVAGPYHDHFASLTPQAVPSLLDAAHARRGARLLDVCTGPGYAAAAAAQRSASAVGLDFSPPMIAHARQRHPDVLFLVGDAEQLPFAGGSFESVITNFGLLHLGHPDLFLQEAHRVLRPHGRIAFTVWAPPEESIGFAIVLQAIQAHGNPSVPLPEGPPFFRFSDEQECRSALQAVGFIDVALSRVPQFWRLADPDDLFQAVLQGTVRTGGLLRAQAPEQLQAIRSAMRQSVQGHREGDVYSLPMPAILASAARP
jgi:SAM-dependent methyltransferase